MRQFQILEPTRREGHPSDSGWTEGAGVMESASAGRGGLCLKAAVTTTYYLVSQGKVLAEYSSLANPPEFTYIYAGDQRIACRDKTGKLFFYLNDHLGSARVVVDTTGIVKDKYRYQSYGADDGQTLSTNQPRRYTGQTWDADGSFDLYYYGRRYYDPTLGRFTQIDPLASKYPAWGPYVYTLDNPMKFVDPDGQERKETLPAHVQEQQEKEKAQQQRNQQAAAKVVKAVGGAAVTAIDNAKNAATAVAQGAVQVAAAVETPAGAAGAVLVAAGVVTADPLLIGAGVALTDVSVGANIIQTAANPTAENVANSVVQVGITAASAGVAAPVRMLRAGQLTATEARVAAVALTGLETVAGLAADKSVPRAIGYARTQGWLPPVQ